MNQNSQFLAQFEEYLRGIVRDSIREAQLPLTAPSISITRDRIGDVALATEITGLARQTIYNLVSKRRIPHAKREGKLIFSEYELRQWLVENKRPMVGEKVDKADQFIVKPTSRRKGNAH